MIILQVDIWSVGCVLGEMALLHPLIPGQDTGDQIGEGGILGYRIQDTGDQIEVVSIPGYSILEIK